MRRLVAAGLLAASVAIPATPALAGPAACVVASGFPVCAGTCSTGDPIVVYAVSNGAHTGTASCGGGSASCTTFRLACSGSDQASGSGALSCGGSARLVVCAVGITVS